MSFRFYHIINALSLDVALGAGVLSLVLGSYLGFRIPMPVLLILVLTVWLIYTGDHLIDARQIKGQASSFRHHFHQHYFQSILVSFVVVAMVVGFLVFQIPRVTVFYGIPVCLGVALYFVLSYYFKLTIQKEFFIAFLYGCGVSVGPLSLYPHPIPSEMIVLLVQLVILAWINLLVFSLFELDDDKRDGLNSTVVSLGEAKTEAMLKMLIASCFAIGISSGLYYSHLQDFVKLQGVFLFMNVILLTLFLRRSTFTREDLQYRYFGDGIFFMPVAYFWF